MSQIKSSQLALVTSDSALPSVEVDMGSIPESEFSFDDILAEKLPSFAAKSKAVTATLYYYYSVSMSFGAGQPTDSAFIGVAGPEKCLAAILRALKNIPGVRTRFGDHISPSSATPMIHIENGILFRPEDSFSWYSNGS
jgi:hypothetical protein